MLWLEDESIETIKQEITAAIPGTVRPGHGHLPVNDKNRYETPLTKEEDDLLFLVLRKQLHRCKPAGMIGCRKNGPCSCGFPFPDHPSRTATQDGSSLVWRYHRPNQDCRNVVPYHAGVLLMWRGEARSSRALSQSRFPSSLTLLPYRTHEFATGKQ